MVFMDNKLFFSLVCRFYNGLVTRWETKELIMLGPKFGEQIQKTPEELGREQGEKLAKQFIKMIWKERNSWKNKRS